MLRCPPGPLGLSRTPIEAPELIDQDDAGHPADALKGDFEGIALDSARYRTCEGKPDTPIESLR
jgi:hypothetical protein